MSDGLERSEAGPVDEGLGSVVAAISRNIVKIHSRFYGRGPTKAKTIWRDNIVCCVLEDVFTKAERLLVEGGHFEQVRSHRIAFQEQVEPLLCRAVEMSTHHYVDAFFGQINREGRACEVFVLGEDVGPDKVPPLQGRTGDKSTR